MTSEVAFSLAGNPEPGAIPEVGAEIMVEINGGIIQSVRALKRLPFPVKVHIRDHDLSRVEPQRGDQLWMLGLPGEAVGF